MKHVPILQDFNSPIIQIALPGTKVGHASFPPVVVNYVKFFGPCTVFHEDGYCVFIRIPTEDFEKYFRLPPKQRPVIQKAFPSLSPDEREFLLNGISPAESDRMYGKPIKTPLEYRCYFHPKDFRNIFN